MAIEAVAHVHRMVGNAADALADKRLERAMHAWRQNSPAFALLVEALRWRGDDALLRKPQ
ncbi:hypothetical protein [Stenotrophomonas sp. TWI819]|uniref:hypothetical protein n=1 Tax=Stenotrophomonas sp. TWI819 TaxID=3136800 RepID=UPI0031C086DD